MTNEKSETIEDIVRVMMVFGEHSAMIKDWAVRLTAAYNRLAIPTPEQWTEFARQGSELERFKGLYQDAMNDNEQMRSYDSKLEADFDALMKDRNALVEKNRECCEENERLREACMLALNSSFNCITCPHEHICIGDKCYVKQVLRSSLAKAESEAAK